MSDTARTATGPSLEVTAPDASGGQPSVRLNVILGPEQIDWLDSESRRINGLYGCGLNRSMILRGIVAGFSRAGANLGNCTDQASIENAVVRWLRTAAIAVAAEKARATRR
jgi:hypothetical protein